MRKGPSYQLKDLEQGCCVNSSKVIVMRLAKDTARKDFKLKTQDAVVQFIAYGGLENPSFINSKPWENNPDPGLIMIDAYGFYSGCTFGYLAFLYHPKTQHWTIKSFKKNDQLDPRVFALAKSKKWPRH